MPHWRSLRYGPQSRQYNFFFIEPLYTFTVAPPQELFALLIFLAVAVLTGSLTGRVRDQRESVIKNAEIMRTSAKRLRSVDTKPLRPSGARMNEATARRQRNVTTTTRRCATRTTSLTKAR